MEKEVKIYALVDPITTKIRYIGRTTVSLRMRLSQHIFSARNYTRKTHKEDWIRSLLKLNSKPLIKQLTVVKGWSESYIYECKLIEKYKDRLLNHDDKGEGSLRNLSQEEKDKISKTLKKRYQEGLVNPARKTIYVYNKDGSFYEEFLSIRQAADNLGIYFRTISKHINGIIPGKDSPTKDGRKRILRNGKQFSVTKVEKMYDYTS